MIISDDEDASHGPNVDENQPKRVFEEGTVLISDANADGFPRHLRNNHYFHSFF